MDIDAIRALWQAGETDRAARAVYDALPVWRRAGWAADVLDLASSRLRVVPERVRAVVEIGRTGRLWAAHDAFSAVRELTLAADRAGGQGVYAAVLGIAEDAAKVMYNASGVEEPVAPGVKAPFDDECGYLLAGGLAHLAWAIESPEFTQQSWAVHESWLGPEAGRRRSTDRAGRRPWWRFWRRASVANEPDIATVRRGPDF